MTGRGFSVRAFRADLRVLEREVVLSLSSDTGCCGVSVAQCHLLLETEARGVTNVTELAAAVVLDKSTLSRTVDGLCRSGLLRRQVDPANRRQQIISLTARGRATAAKINAACDESYERLFDFIPAAKRSAVAEAIGLLAGAMRRKRKEPDSACCADETDDVGGASS
jgi:DNA-binding MarR family transcriptional regulator